MWVKVVYHWRQFVCSFMFEYLHTRTYVRTYAHPNHTSSPAHLHLLPCSFAGTLARGRERTSSTHSLNQGERPGGLKVQQWMEWARDKTLDAHTDVHMYVRTYVHIYRHTIGSYITLHNIAFRTVHMHALQLLSKTITDKVTHTQTYKAENAYWCVCVRACVRACMCVWEREK